MSRGVSDFLSSRAFFDRLALARLVAYCVEALTHLFTESANLGPPLQCGAVMSERTWPTHYRLCGRRVLSFNDGRHPSETIAHRSGFTGCRSCQSCVCWVCAKSGDGETFPYEALTQQYQHFSTSWPPKRHEPLARDQTNQQTMLQNLWRSITFENVFPHLYLLFNYTCLE